MGELVFWTPLPHTRARDPPGYMDDNSAAWFYFCEVILERDVVHARRVVEC